MLSLSDGVTTVTFLPTHEPPRPVLNPRPYQRRLINRWMCLSSTSEGRNLGRPVTFTSTARMGFVTYDQAAALIDLYEGGAGITLTTDLLRPAGSTPQAYDAVFAPDSPPTFSPVTPDGTLYALDMTLIVAGAL